MHNDWIVVMMMIIKM